MTTQLFSSPSNPLSIRFRLTSPRITRLSGAFSRRFADNRGAISVNDDTPAAIEPSRRSPAERDISPRTESRRWDPYGKRGELSAFKPRNERVRSKIEAEGAKSTLCLSVRWRRLAADFRSSPKRRGGFRPPCEGQRGFGCGSKGAKVGAEYAASTLCDTSND